MNSLIMCAHSYKLVTAKSAKTITEENYSMKAKKLRFKEMILYFIVSLELIYLNAREHDNLDIFHAKV